MNFKNLFFLTLIPCLLSLVSIPAHAAELRLESRAQTVAPAREFKVDLSIFPEGENVNAIQARIIYPIARMELREIRDGGSIVSLWVERPRAEPDGSVFFSGVIPGGFADEKGLLLSLIFRGAGEGNAVVDLVDVKVLLNDGEGTETRAQHRPLSLTFSSDASLGTEEIPQDTVPPEQFTPHVSRDPSLFEGNYFLVFSTTDKGTGIDRYEVGEAFPGTDAQSIPWKVADSPYLLLDQELSRDIYVRAVDRAGNFVVARLPAQHPKPRASAGGLVGVLLLVLVLVAVQRLATQWIASKKRRRG